MWCVCVCMCVMLISFLCLSASQSQVTHFHQMYGQISISFTHLKQTAMSSSLKKPPTTSALVSSLFVWLYVHLMYTRVHVCKLVFIRFSVKSHLNCASLLHEYALRYVSLCKELQPIVALSKVGHSCFCCCFLLLLTSLVYLY